MCDGSRMTDGCGVRCDAGSASASVGDGFRTCGA